MTSLSAHHQETYDALFRHPIAHNLHRRDVSAMLGALANVVEEPNGNVKATRNGQTLVLHGGQDQAVIAPDELMNIRHFLERSEGGTGALADDVGHFLVVIDHREARIYKTEVRDSVPQRVEPYDPNGFGRNLRYVQSDASGQRKPERKSFYEAIATTLRNATQILVFGSGTGASSAMEQLLADLKREHPDLARRVVGTVTLDVQHMTEHQLLAKAREFYGSQPIPAGAK